MARRATHVVVIKYDSWRDEPHMRRDYSSPSAALASASTAGGRWNGAAGMRIQDRCRLHMCDASERSRPNEVRWGRASTSTAVATLVCSRARPMFKDMQRGEHASNAH